MRWYVYRYIEILRLMNWYIGILIYLSIDISIHRKCWCFNRKMYILDIQTIKVLIFHWFSCSLCIPRRRLGQLAGPGWAAWTGWAGEAVQEQPKSKKTFKHFAKLARHSIFSWTFWTAWTPNTHFWPENASSTFGSTLPHNHLYLLSPPGPLRHKLCLGNINP